MIFLEVKNLPWKGRETRDFPQLVTNTIAELAEETYKYDGGTVNIAVKDNEAVGRILAAINMSIGRAAYAITYDDGHMVEISAAPAAAPVEPPRAEAPAPAPATTVAAPAPTPPPAPATPVIRYPAVVARTNENNPGINANQLAMALNRNTVADTEIPTLLFRMKGANAAAQEAALKQALKTYADYMAAVTRELRKINELSAVIQDDDAVKSVMTQIERIRSAMPGNKIEDVYVTTGHIVFKTGVIHAHNSRTNRRHNLGRILMMVPIESLIGQMANPIVFQPLDFVLKGSANNTAYMIPHVSGNGGFCYGNATDPMIQAVAQRDLITLVDIAIRFVENPNMGDGMGEVLKYWPEVE